MFLHPAPKPKSKVQKWVSFSPHTLLFFNFFFIFLNISPVIMYFQFQSKFQ